MKPRFPLVYQFGPFSLHLPEPPAGPRLLRNEQEVRLRPKVVSLLCLLVENHGRMMTKDELLKALWPDAIVEENNLTVTVFALRRALGEDHFIETVSQGYRFAADVKRLAPSRDPATLYPPGGALPLDSAFYLARPADREFQTAIARRDCLVMVKGARQIGKTSLLARGLQQAREAGARVVLTDFQQLTAPAFESIEKLLRELAEMITDQLDLPAAPQQTWNDLLSPGVNFERYLRRQVLPQVATLVWGLDEVDRLFGFDYSTEVFGLFRSWHNLRALDPAGPWGQITLAFAYATEAHLFITDLNQSPFNVGTRLSLEDFTLEQIAELNQRYGQPLRGESEQVRFHALLGGHPYLTQRGLYELVRRAMSIAALEARADDEDGPFGDHLRRTWLALEHDKELSAAFAGVLREEQTLTRACFYRLRSAGLLIGDSPATARPRCQLYERYFRKQLL